MNITNPLAGLAVAILMANLRSTDELLASESFFELQSRGVTLRNQIPPKNPLGMKSTAELMRMQRYGETQLERYAAFREEKRLDSFHASTKYVPYKPPANQSKYVPIVPANPSPKPQEQPVARAI